MPKKVMHFNEGQAMKWNGNYYIVESVETGASGKIMFGIRRPGAIGVKDFVICPDEYSDVEQASIEPDFSNAIPGQECWVYGYGDCVMLDIEKKDDGRMFIQLQTNDGLFTIDEHGYIRDIHEYTQQIIFEFMGDPIAFNEFQQFIAYWLEK